LVKAEMAGICAHREEAPNSNRLMTNKRFFIRKEVAFGAQVTGKPVSFIQMLF
jgi:hypothetical protein